MDLNLPLVDKRELVFMNKLDGVFDGDDVLLLPLVDPVDHGGEGGGFSASRWTGDKNQSLGEEAEVEDHRWELDLFRG